MLEIEYAIGEIKTSMFIADNHSFLLTVKQWIKADALNVDDQIAACDGTAADILSINKIDDPQYRPDLKLSHNHHYFVTKGCISANDKISADAPTDPLEAIAYLLANRPSKLPDGTPTGDHAGPWAAARYFNRDTNEDVIGWGRANDDMCAEDAAISDLRHKFGDATELHRGNVKISHAYIRKYTRKGRFVNKMSPCTHCRDNYGHALNDVTMGTSDVVKKGRGYLVPVGE